MITQIGGSVARKLKGEMQTAFTDENIDYTVGLQVVDPFQGYVYENEEYFPEPQAVPFETQFFPDELASGKWKKQKKWATKRDVKDVTDSVNNLHTKREAIEWRAGLKVTDPLQLYVYDGVEYLPNKDVLPFTTGATFNSDNWVLSDLLTKEYLKSLGDAKAWGCAGDYLLANGTVNPNPTDDTVILTKILNTVGVLHLTDGFVFESSGITTSRFDAKITGNGRIHYSKNNVILNSAYRVDKSVKNACTHGACITSKRCYR